MRLRHTVVVAILVYIALDLSSTSIPGAFMFDTTQSVESTPGRTRGADEGAIEPPSFCVSFVLAQLRMRREERPSGAVVVDREWRPLLSRHPRALLDPAPPTADPD